MVSPVAAKPNGAHRRIAVEKIFKKNIKIAIKKTVIKTRARRKPLNTIRATRDKGVKGVGNKAKFYAGLQ